MKLGNGNSVVIVDDSDLDIEITKRYYSRSKVSNNIIDFESGEDFLDFLHKIQEGHEEMPAVVLLDINMPGLDGFQVLKETRKLSEFKRLPIFVMFTNSDNPKDREKAMALGADGFATKEEVFEDFSGFMTNLKEKLEHIL